MPALEQLNSALKICQREGHAVTHTYGDGGMYLNISHADISGSRLVIPDMATGDDALDILVAALNALVAEGFSVRRHGVFRAVWLHIPSVRISGGKLVAL